MPVRVFVTLPPADGPAVTEDVLAQQVMQEFMAMRHAGSSVELLCSVSSARLQQTIAERYPLAYNRLLLEGALARQVAFLCGGNCGTALLPLHTEGLR
ncbi:hypothetical protein C4B63_35g1 [Trypanosoma cruzi]|uniref:Uncharacterized protein n=1 Tax=Trypanosoma cruzi TaxID=5693 RepID=A0A2V2V8F4_TRYCR|nr:hypothetical protein C4B63_35g1 [Trypanosoma cruzi]